MWLHKIWLVCQFMRIWSQHWLCKHHDATKLLWKVNDEICQWNLLTWFCNLDFKRPRGTTKAFYSYGVTLKKKSKKKKQRFTDKNKPRQLSYFCFVNSLFKHIGESGSLHFHLNVLKILYSCPVHFKMFNDKYIIAHITARHICESLL